MVRLVGKETDKVTQADWASCVHHAVTLQEDDYAKELGCDKILEAIIINL
jgi:hypothetical protein